jgi:mitogen-activated protein kinase kinase kinase 6
METPADDPFSLSQGSRLSRDHVEQLLRCLGAHIHTPNRRQLAQELRALQAQLRAQGLEPTLLNGPLFAFPDAVRELPRS